MKAVVVLFSVSVLLVSGCRQKESVSRVPAMSDGQAIAIAKEAAQEAFGRLSGDLALAMKDGGPPAAVSVCADKAPAIIREMADERNLGMVRLSDRARNPGHLASGADLATIEQFRKTLAEGESVKPVVEKQDDGSLAVRMPILITQELCLQCHGSKDEIAVKTREAIQKAYPDDRAHGYRLNELRGIWRITVPTAPVR